jgi:TusA-related sulfurtransferase
MCTRKLREMAIGEAMEVLADDPLFASDVRAWCGHSGHVLRSFEQKADHCVAVVERGR